MSRHLRKENDCLNCGSLVDGRYCSHCGQENVVPRERLSYILADFLGGFLVSFDNKFFKSVVPLLFRPGLLTNHYNAGKRASYVHPFKLYIFISIFYFFLTGLFHQNVNYHVEAPAPNLAALGAESDVTKAIEIGSDAQNSTITRFETVTDYRKYQASLPENQRDNALSSFFIERIIIVNERGGNISEKIGEGVAKKVPTVIFFMLPAFAIFLKLFFGNEKRYYIEHFYHSVYIHSFVFVLLSAKSLLELVAPASVEKYFGLLLFLIPIYIYRSCRMVYKQGTGAIVVRLVFAGIGYLFFLVVFAVAAVLLSIAAL